MRARHLLATPLALFLACSNGKGGPNGLVDGEACASPGAQGSCATGYACKSYVASGGAPVNVCRATCATSTDCNQVFTENRCVSGFCTCSPGPIGADACTADDPVTVCHPDYGYCAPGLLPDAGCAAGEAPSPYDGVVLCRPAGVAADGGPDGGGGASCGLEDSQGDCPWPQYCGPGGCAFPQNVDDAGADSPDPACALGGSNVDQLRQSHGSPFAPPQASAPGGPILIQMTQDQTGLYCNQGLGPADSAPNGALCLGDGTYCDVTDDVAIFTGFVYDPSGSFEVAQGTQLDEQFFAIAETGSNAGQGVSLATLDPSVATNQIGHVVPSNGDWSAAGGEFILWRCFLHASVGSQISSGLPAHYAQTTAGPGNTYCATWSASGG